MADLKAPPRWLARVLAASAFFCLAMFNSSGGIVDIDDELIDASLAAVVRTSIDTTTGTHDLGPQIQTDPAVVDEILAGSFDSGYAYGSTEISLETSFASLLHKKLGASVHLKSGSVIIYSEEPPIVPIDFIAGNAQADFLYSLQLRPSAPVFLNFRIAISGDHLIARNLSLILFDAQGPVVLRRDQHDQTNSPAIDFNVSTNCLLQPDKTYIFSLKAQLETAGNDIIISGQEEIDGHLAIDFAIEVALPALQFQLTEPGFINLQWPAGPYNLESSSDFQTWNPLYEIPVSNDGTNTLTLSSSSSNLFFRLVSPP